MTTNNFQIPIPHIPTHNPETLIKIEIDSGSGNKQLKTILNPEWLESFLGHIYEKLPVVTKSADEETNFSTARYLSSAGNAVIDLIKDITNLWVYLDPWNCPSEFLPVYYECFGLPWFPDIPEYYLRKIVSVVGDLYVRKGTKGAIIFLTSELTGYKVDVVDKRESYFRTWHPDFDLYPNTKLSYLSAAVSRPDSVTVLQDFLSNSYGKKRISEIYLELTVTDKEDEIEGQDSVYTLTMGETVLRRFINYFMPFDVIWSFYIKLTYYDNWDFSTLSESKVFHDLITNFYGNETLNVITDERLYDLIRIFEGVETWKHKITDSQIYDLVRDAYSDNYTILDRTTEVFHDLITSFYGYDSFTVITGEVVHDFIQSYYDNDTWLSTIIDSPFPDLVKDVYPDDYTISNKTTDDQSYYDINFTLSLDIVVDWVKEVFHDLVTDVWVDDGHIIIMPGVETNNKAFVLNNSFVLNVINEIHFDKFNAGILYSELFGELQGTAVSANHEQDALKNLENKVKNLNTDQTK